MFLLDVPGARGVHTSASRRAPRHDVGVAEGDTVHATARLLGDRLAGRALTRTDFRVPRFAAADLSGRTLLEVAARGKHLLMRTDREETIHSHLGMDGSWSLQRAGDRRRGRPFEIRAVLQVDGWTAIGYRLRRLDIFRTSRENEVLGDLGPDPLGADWDASEAVRRLTAGPDRSIGEALLDQAVIAGPGNVYRSEVCFLAGVDPRTEVREVPDPGHVVDLVRSLMEVNRDGGRRSTTGDGRRGHEHWVYGRAGRPCRRCGTPVQRFEVAGRVAYRCPSCQGSR
jgi:endonuclease-8